MKFRSKVDITVLGRAEQRINKQATTRHSKRSFLCLLFFTPNSKHYRFGSMSQR